MSRGALSKQREQNIQRDVETKISLGNHYTKRSLYIFQVVEDYAKEGLYACCTLMLTLYILINQDKVLKKKHNYQVRNFRIMLTFYPMCPLPRPRERTTCTKDTRHRRTESHQLMKLGQHRLSKKEVRNTLNIYRGCQRGKRGPIFAGTRRRVRRQFGFYPKFKGKQT